MPVLIKTKVYILVRDIVNTRLNHFNKNKKNKHELRLRYCQRWDCLTGPGCESYKRIMCVLYIVCPVSGSQYIMSDM